MTSHRPPTWLLRLALVNLLAARLAYRKHHEAVALAITLFDLWFFSELWLEPRSQTLPRKEEDFGSKPLLQGIRDASLLLPAWFAPGLSGATPASEIMLVPAGGILFLTGLFIRIKAMRELGRHFTMALTRQADHQLITHGLYGRMRHPGYLGLLLIYGSFSLVCASLPLFVGIAAISLAGLGYRIRLEEGLLLRVFGAQYSDYRARTWALVPRVVRAPGKEHRG